jgi:FAD/FMN-containing dehydrogenase
VTGSCSSVGMAGLTLGGGYGSLIGRFGLALDNLLAAEIVLADGRIVTAEQGREEDLFWALRGGGGNFGVVAAMRIRLHGLPNVVSGMLVYPFSEAKTVLRRYADLASAMPDELTVQVGAVAGPDGVPVIMLVPTWSGWQGQGDEHIAPLLELGTLLANTVDAVRYGTSVSVFDRISSTGTGFSWKPARYRRSTTPASTFLSRLWRATSSEAQLRACRWKRQRSASVATTC